MWLIVAPLLDRIIVIYIFSLSFVLASYGLVKQIWVDGKIDLPFDLASCIAPKSYKGSVLSYQPVWADGKWDTPDGSRWSGRSLIHVFSSGGTKDDFKEAFSSSSVCLFSRPILNAFEPVKCFFEPSPCEGNFYIFWHITHFFCFWPAITLFDQFRLKLWLILLKASWITLSLNAY